MGGLIKINHRQFLVLRYSVLGTPDEKITMKKAHKLFGAVYSVVNVTAIMVLLSFFVFAIWGMSNPRALALPLETLTLPPGYKIELYAEVPGPRSMTVSDDLGVVFVGTRGSSIYAIIDQDKNGQADKTQKLLEGLRAPNGVAWHDGALYIAEQHRVLRLSVPDLSALESAVPDVVFDGLPRKSWHGNRYLSMGPDEMLYVAIGSPCNVCAVSGMDGTIIRIDPKSGRSEIYATGVRNSVGMDFHPLTKELFFTDNGADWMGDDSPPGEFNRAAEKGLFFGFPYYGGGDARTDDFEDETPPKSVMPVVRFNAHVAPLGIHFYRGDQFPPDVKGDAFIAQHGSWNRSTPIGYRVMQVLFDDTGRVLSHQPFIEGWLDLDGDAWGRPVDVKELADGSLLVSDDRRDVIYRVFYAPKASPAP
jgi:glucose/arabinose dehydrogenase